MDYFIRNDMEGMVRDTYTEDAILQNAFNFRAEPAPNVIRGHKELIEHLTAYLDYQGEIQVKSLYNFLEIDDCISFQATILSPKTGYWAVGDCWLMRDGKIARHIGFAHRLGDTAPES